MSEEVIIFKFLILKDYLGGGNNFNPVWSGSFFFLIVLLYSYLLGAYLWTPRGFPEGVRDHLFRLDFCIPEKIHSYLIMLFVSLINCRLCSHLVETMTQ